MTILANTGIGRRLLWAAIALVAVLGGMAAFSWSRLDDLHNLTLDTEKIRVPQLQRVADIELNVTRVSLQIRHALLVRNDEDLKATLADIGAKRKHIEETFQAYGNALTSDIGKTEFARIQPVAQAFWEIGSANIEQITAGQKDAAFDTLVSKTIPARNKLLEALAGEKKRQGEWLARDLKDIDDRATLMARLIVGMVALAGAVLLTAAWMIANTLRRRVAVAQRVADAVREGDLSVVVKDDVRDEFSPLLAGLSQMQTSLAQVVSTVRRNAESVATGSAQIAQGNQDLSGRTEQQASALERTASAMEQLGSTVRQNADNAQQANQLAMGASTVAVQGGDVVGQVVETMKGINESSKKIADIISVIDGIAFQTNILALNAAVEAARAGEQGRGFAVVAGEVRSLAQRSAEAAREIKQLITASVDRVEQGSALVDKAGHTMEEVVTAIRRVTDIMGEISTASAEQSAGVAQVGHSVTEMDQATQQNAALVEESAAAAESLRTQAQQLVQAVAVFKLGGQDSQPSYSAAPAVVAKPAPVVAKAPAAPRAVPSKPQTPPPPPAPAATAPAAPAVASTASDDDWTTF
ncbi:methyl-accepting chemotaxis protein [Ideonella paludis]|uniref:MCP four helix bundle domain-containing protein n=1 Tax=Ideonella paludis TaxID=1233411 RepID=A0ABS5DZR6_9BURK|nr:methyl-accepting chemotaxis protein [Ideonella paludis]MBQ0936628.1 MCP four helix bundle domain-containing protein [Ideonella paludis]